MSWVGWRCQRCRHEFKNNQRFCPQCGYTVYDPIQAEERPDWIVTAPSTELPPLEQPWATNIAPTVWAVQLTEDTDWDAIAAWVGGTVETTRDASDEYQSCITIPRPEGSPQVAHDGWWVIRNEANGRHIVSPTCVSAEVVADLRVRMGGSEDPVVATIRSAFDDWKTQSDPFDHRGVSMPEYIRRALADAGLLAPEAQQLTAEVERLTRSEQVGVETLDELRGRISTLSWLLRGMARRVGDWRRTSAEHYASFYEANQERDEVLAALEKQQAAMAKLDHDSAAPSSRCTAVPPQDVVERVALWLFRAKTARLKAEDAERAQRAWDDVIDQSVQEAWIKYAKDMLADLGRAAPVSESVPATPPMLATVPPGHERSHRNDTVDLAAIPDHLRASAPSEPTRWREGDIALDHTNFVHRRFEHGWRVVGRDCGVQYDDESMETALGPMLKLASVPVEVDVLGSVPIDVAERLRAEARRA